MSNNCESFSEKELEVIDTIKEIIHQKGRNVSAIKYNKTLLYVTVAFFDITYMRINIKATMNYLSIPKHLEDILQYVNCEYEIKKSDWIRLYFQDTLDIHKYTNVIIDIYDHCHSKQIGEIFGCCSHYIECSDARKCVKENEDWSRACYYRKNLNSGKIFYGINAN